VLCEPNVFSRLWRAEAASAGWTLARSWVSRTIVTDDDGTEILRYEPGAWGRGPIVPASGPELKLRRHWIGGFSLETRDGHELLTLERAPGSSAATTGSRCRTPCAPERTCSRCWR